RRDAAVVCVDVQSARTHTRQRVTATVHSVHIHSNASHAQQRVPQSTYARRHHSMHTGQRSRTPAHPAVCQQCPASLGDARQHARALRRPSTRSPCTSRLSVMRSCVRQYIEIPIIHPNRRPKPVSDHTTTTRTTRRRDRRRDRRQPTPHAPPHAAGRNLLLELVVAREKADFRSVNAVDFAVTSAFWIGQV
ncbi:Unknown protein, partial [Striga hermonthica]